MGKRHGQFPPDSTRGVVRETSDAHLASQSLISVVLRRLSSRSSARGSGSFLWCSHHSRTWASRAQRGSARVFASRVLATASRILPRPSS